MALTLDMSDAPVESLPADTFSGFDSADVERYLLALAAIDLTVYDWNIETGTIDHPPLGRQARQRWAIQPKTGDEWAAIIHPDDLGEFRTCLIAHLRGLTPRIDCEYRYRGAAGEWRWMRQYGIALRRADRRAYRVVGATTDISDIRSRDEELQAARVAAERTRRYMQALLDNMRDGVGSATADGTYIASNAAMFELIGIPRQKILELGTMQNIWRYQYENRLVPRVTATADEYVAMQFALFSRGDGAGTVRPRPDGSWVERSFHRLPDDSRLVMVRDVTEMMQRETELARERDAAEAARAEAEAADQAKSTFLATMSHEIRTPMNGVLGMLEVLERQDITETQRGIVATMRSSASALLRIIDDVLDFSKIEAGRLELEETRFVLTELVRGTVEALRPQAAAKGLQISSELLAGSADTLIGDPVRVRQILFNLLGNAVKFTQAGSVHVLAATTALGEGRQRVTLTVVDTGIGISEDEQARLFQPFAQADSSTTRRFGGSGLGLSIVRRLAQLMSGDVVVNSTPGLGSTFTVALHLRSAPAQLFPRIETAPQPRPANHRVGGRVLVVDDHPVNRQVLMSQLGLLGLRVDTASDGTEALSMWRPGRYAAVLADMHMPRMDGYGLTARIRMLESAASAARTPIVAVTANAMRGEEERCLEAGMDGYLAKPVAIAKLSAVLGRWIAIEPPERVPQSAIDRSVLRGWLGDNEAAIQSLLTEFLSNARQMVRDIAVAVTAGEAPAARMAAHNLRGAALSVGAHALAKVAAELEAAVYAGDIPYGQQALHPLTLELERAEQEVGGG